MNKPFRKRPNTPQLSAEAAARQGRVARIAWEKLPAGAAVEFLNAHHEGLGGRPIDLAIASDAGLSAVEGAIAAYPA